MKKQNVWKVFTGNSNSYRYCYSKDVANDVRDYFKVAGLTKVMIKKGKM